MTPTNQPESDKHTCPECGGHGRYADNETCYLCGGTGFDPGPLVEPQQPDTELWHGEYMNSVDEILDYYDKYHDRSLAELHLKHLLAAECQAARTGERISTLKELSSVNPIHRDSHIANAIYQTEAQLISERNYLSALRSASRKDAE